MAVMLQPTTLPTVLITFLQVSQQIVSPVMVKANGHLPIGITTICTSLSLAENTKMNGINAAIAIPIQVITAYLPVLLVTLNQRPIAIIMEYPGINTIAMRVMRVTQMEKIDDEKVAVDIEFYLGCNHP